MGGGAIGSSAVAIGGKDWQLHHVVADRCIRRGSLGDVIDHQASVGAGLLRARAVLHGSALQQSRQFLVVWRQRNAFKALVESTSCRCIRQRGERQAGGCSGHHGGWRLDNALHVASLVEIIDVGTIFVGHIERAIVEEAQTLGIKADLACRNSHCRAGQGLAILGDESANASGRIQTSGHLAVEILEKESTGLHKSQLVLRVSADWQIRSGGIGGEVHCKTVDAPGVIAERDIADAIGSAIREPEHRACITGCGFSPGAWQNVKSRKRPEGVAIEIQSACRQSRHTLQPLVDKDLAIESGGCCPGSGCDIGCGVNSGCGESLVGEHDAKSNAGKCYAGNSGKIATQTTSQHHWENPLFERKKPLAEIPLILQPCATDRLGHRSETSYPWTWPRKLHPRNPVAKQP